MANQMFWIFAGLLRAGPRAKFSITAGRGPRAGLRAGFTQIAGRRLGRGYEIPARVQLWVALYIFNSILYLTCILLYTSCLNHKFVLTNG